MRANCWEGAKHLKLEDVPDPKILNQGDCIVRITSTAICGSDLHLFNGFMPTMEPGHTPGHEFMGEVLEVGRNVRSSRLETVSWFHSRLPAESAGAARTTCG